MNGSETKKELDPDLKEEVTKDDSALSRIEALLIQLLREIKKVNNG